jgi:hypothetical protein
MKISTTKNYKRFSLLPMNREIMSRHAERMAESIQIMGVIRPVVCCETTVLEGTKKLYILDGQHLFTGLQRLDMEIPWTKLKVTSELDIVKKMGLLNSSSKSWNLMDYVNAYKMYIPDYMQLFKLKNLYNIELSMLAAICGLNSSYDSGGGTNFLKEGKFKIVNKNPDEMCKKLSELFAVIPGIDHNLKRKIMRARLSRGNNYDHVKTIINMKKHKNTLEIMGSEHGTIEFLQKNVFK